MLCRVMKVSTSAYYAACLKPLGSIDAYQFRLEAKVKTLFSKHNQRIGSRQMVGLLKNEGFNIGRYLWEDYPGNMFRVTDFTTNEQVRALLLEQDKKYGIADLYFLSDEYLDNFLLISVCEKWYGSTFMLDSKEADEFCKYIDYNIETDFKYSLILRSYISNDLDFMDLCLGKASPYDEDIYSLYVENNEWISNALVL